MWMLWLYRDGISGPVPNERTRPFMEQHSVRTMELETPLQKGKESPPLDRRIQFNAPLKRETMVRFLKSSRIAAIPRLY